VQLSHLVVHNLKVVAARGVGTALHARHAFFGACSSALTTDAASKAPCCTRTRVAGHSRQRGSVDAQLVVQVVHAACVAVHSPVGQ